MARGARDEGFSLIELLVAVSILALAAVSLLEHQTQALGMTGAVERRALAATVADNRLATTLGQTKAPVPGTTTGQETQMGVAFEWQQMVRPAEGGDLTLVQVSVREAEGGRELASLTGFRRVD